MTSIRSYRDLDVWQLAEDIFTMVCADYRELPKDRIAWVIGDQVVRSAGSIGANIAEGFARQPKKEFLHFLSIARGSRAETEVWTGRMHNQKFISDERHEEYCGKLERVAKMLNALMRSLRTPRTNEITN